MKVSKSLLKAILVGVTVGTAVTSCDTLKEKNEILIPCDENCSETCEGKHVFSADDCPGCGLG